LPDMATASAIALAVNSSGTVKSRTTVLIPVEEVDTAAKREVHFRPPGA